ncbi:MAG: deoxyribose-phosphate aldolase [Verrucomicrobiota bacterium]
MKPGQDLTRKEIAGMIDHALLKPQHTVDELESGCAEALELGVASVWILPHYLSRCASILRGSGVAASTVIGFPHGTQAPGARLAEVEQALEDGGEELDVVVNVSRVVSGDWAFVRDDLAPMVGLTHGAGRKIKIIFENAYLNENQKIRLCEVCSELEVDWVKTSTGFGPGGATAADLQLMVDHTPPAIAVKASGGLRELKTLLRFYEIGANRFGASGTRAILDQIEV